MSDKYVHIKINEYYSSLDYTSPQQARPKNNIPNRERESHAQRLQRSFEELRILNQEERVEREALSLRSREGTYIQFSSQSGKEIITKSLEDIRQNIRLLNVREELDNEEITVIATVYVPEGKEKNFLQKIEDYRTKTVESGKAKNEKLINGIEDVRLAMVESLWTDRKALIPGDTPVWCEVWLRFESDEMDLVSRNFLNTLEELGIEHKDARIVFPERLVFLVKCKNQDLKELIARDDNLAEFRLGHEAAGFWYNESRKEQIDWINDLLDRLNVHDNSVSICVMDTGINNEHSLLKPFLAEDSCLSVDPKWLNHDHSGHGTLMAGLAIFNSLEDALTSTGDYHVYHDLISVKILPNEGENPVELWGDITSQAMNRALIHKPNNTIIFCMAVTADVNSHYGEPSSWSAAVDKLCFGEEDDASKLVILSAGNLENINDWRIYPDSNLQTSVKNPAQSWNALSIGAFTRKVEFDGDEYSDYFNLANIYGLSPYSSTSSEWDSKWPYKPDVVFEGGNILKAKDDSEFMHGYEDFNLLSTSKHILIRQFDLMRATSAASAQAAWFAAQIANKYPELSSETIRGLIVHAAELKDEMYEQFGLNRKMKTDVKKIMKIFGYGIPDLDKALYTYNNALTYIAEEEIQPFIKKENGQISFKDMHFYKIPWPEEILIDNPDAEVKVKITLSYFIEPGPGRIGWKDKYRYRSHGFGFDLNSPTESEEEFKKRINKAAIEDDDLIENDSGSDRWTVGSQGRKKGSIHSDTWTGKASEIASCNMIGIFPIMGWWRQRSHLKRYNSITKYSLIISLETPEQNLDLYTPVMTKIATPIEINS
ncbi:S8 family peptidase [Salegentibacter sp. BDJ18]|uniref:S8 family peptidase n=1 Tax=Salegentibacter sp. BDJ18 TaxID=2816376 RepID=UPI001AAED9FC|nr:S8 family peptidase [Salegentibacter sp. BDJ18]MBO2544073.1 S8 family peptidase [Salegentibacter sp. BDJ18]